MIPCLAADQPSIRGEGGLDLHFDEAQRKTFARVTCTTQRGSGATGGPAVQSDIAAAFERIDGYQRDYGHTFWVVERKADGALLGFCGLKRVNNAGAPNSGDFEIGWRLREDAWGQGYAQEAAIASLDLAFGRFAAPHVVALTVTANRPSQALMERLGMTRREDLDFDCSDPWVADFNPVIAWRIEAAEWPEARERALRPLSRRAAPADR